MRRGFHLFVLVGLPERSFICWLVCLSVRMMACPSFRSLVGLSVFLFVCCFIHVFVCACVDSLVHLSFCLSVRLFICACVS
jgi:hypothetical protein